jgi:hypothetical protein
MTDYQEIVIDVFKAVALSRVFAAFASVYKLVRLEYLEI